MKHTLETLRKTIVLETRKVAIEELNVLEEELRDILKPASEGCSKRYWTVEELVKELLQEK